MHAHRRSQPGRRYWRLIRAPSVGAAVGPASRNLWHIRLDETRGTPCLRSTELVAALRAGKPTAEQGRYIVKTQST